jgi:hypothetical protein
MCIFFHGNAAAARPHRVMVMERLRGVALTDLDAIRSITGAQPELVLINALNVWFGSVVGCPTFHADVHAGGLGRGGGVRACECVWWWWWCVWGGGAHGRLLTVWVPIE